MRLSRDPALWTGFAAAAIQFFSALIFPLTSGQQAGLNAVVVAVAGLVTAIWVRRDGQAAALVGFAQAVIAGGLHFGLDLSPEQQAAIMAIVTTGVAMFVRTQVTAPVSAVGDRQV
jgi:threonine/homoserine efflux transporter RhtA